MNEKDVWGFEWDDIDKAEKEEREKVFGPDRDFVEGQRFCFECGEIHIAQEKLYLRHCPFCGWNYKEARKAKQVMAMTIDEAWPEMNREERDEFKRMVKRLRSVSPEFRAMWKKGADAAALKRFEQKYNRRAA